MKFANLFLLLVVACNYNEKSNLVYSYLVPFPETIPSFRDGAGHYLTTTESNRHQSKGETKDGRSYKIRAQDRKRKKKPIHYNQYKSDNASQKIRDCKNLQELFELQRHAEVNHFDISYYWCQVASFMFDESEIKKIQKDPKILKPLVKQTLDFSDSLKNPRSLAAMAHAFAKISYRTRKPIINSEKLWRALENDIIEAAQTKNFDSRNCANILWAFAKQNRKSDRLFRLMENQVISNIDTFNSQDIANTVWAYAKLGHSSPKLFDAISLKAMEKLDAFNSQNIANTVWAYATVRHSSPKLFNAISQKTINELDAFNSQAIANTVWAYATLGHSSPKLFHAVSRKAMKKLDSFNSQETANTVWAYATLGHSSPKLFDAISRKAMKEIDAFNSQEIANTVWAYATLGHSSPKLFNAISNKAMEKLDDFNSQEITNTVWAYATLGHPSPKLFDAISNKAMEKIDTFNSQDIANTVWAYATIEYKIDSIKLDTFVSKATSELEDFKIQELINLLWSLSVFNFENIDAVDPLLSKINESYNLLINNEVDSSKMPAEELRQLHQVILWYNEECKKDFLLSPKLRKESKLAFIAAESCPSKLQKDVRKSFESLERLGLVVVDEEANCDQTGYSLDIVIGMKNSQKEMAVEIDGPSHFINLSPNGATRLKRRQIGSLATRPLLSIPYWEWNQLSCNSNRKHEQARKKRERDDKNDEKDRKQLYLQKCLQEASFL